MRRGLNFTGHKRAAVAAMTGAAAAAVLGLAVPASASQAAVAAVTGTEHFQFATTSPTASSNQLIAYGVLTAAGVERDGAHNTGTVTFSNGTIKLKHDNGTGSQSFNAKTCLMQINVHGKYTVTGGTGKYAGVTGHGTYTVSILAIGPKTKSGACSNSQTVPPIAFQQVVDTTGTITLK
jgi:hypothetical protein